MRFALFVSSLVLFFPSLASAATLYFSPASGTYSVGQTIAVSVYVSSPNESINAISGDIIIPTEYFSIVSASSVGSIVNFWIEQPTVSGAAVSFEGVVLNPGYQGAGGKVASFVLMAKKAGVGALSFSGASVLANDGQGTNVLTSAGTASLSVQAAAQVPLPATPSEAPIEETPEEKEVLEPSAFLISSRTHPDQDAWYNKTTGIFSWDIPEGASATRLILSSSPSATPAVTYDTAIGEKRIDDLPEGISYLRVQHKVNGAWGGIGTYRVKTDLTPPEPFSITFPHGAEGINPQPIILFNTTDELSGVAEYDVKVGEGDLFTRAAAADSNPYTLPLQEPGAHIVVVIASDRAGNTTSEEAVFRIEGIEPPQITQYQEMVAFGDLVKFHGVTYENADVELYVYEGDERVTTEYTRSNSLGDFTTVVAKRLNAGTYTVTARVIDARGARSPQSDPLIFRVKGNVLTALNSFVSEHPIPLILVVFVLVGCIGLHFYGWRRFFRFAHDTRARQEEATDITKKVFAILKKDLATHVRKMREAGEKRTLTEEEIAFLEDFEEELAQAETALRKRRKK